MHNADFAGYYKNLNFIIDEIMPRRSKIFDMICCIEV